MTQIVPVDSGGWTYAKSPQTKEYWSKHECGQTSVHVSDVTVHSRLLAIGILIPVIPAPIPMGTWENVTIRLLLPGNQFEPSEESLTIALPDKTVIKPQKFEKLREPYYIYTFPIRGDDIESFDLSFQEPFYECRLPTLHYEKKVVFRGGLANMGP
jgi:hypothetical protein